MSLKLVTTAREYAERGLKRNPLFEEMHDCLDRGGREIRIRGWFIDSATGKHIEAEPHYLPRYANQKEILVARHKIAAELGAM